MQIPPEYQAPLPHQWQTTQEEGLGDNLTWVLENKKCKPGLQQVERWQPQTGKLWRPVYPVSRRRNSGWVSATVTLAPAVRQYENDTRCLSSESSWDMGQLASGHHSFRQPLTSHLSRETFGYPSLKSPPSGPKSLWSHKKVPDKHLLNSRSFHGESILWLQQAPNLRW